MVLYKNVLVLLTLLAVITSAAAKKPPTLEELYSKTDGYLTDPKNQIRVERVDSTDPMYMAYAYATINAPFEKVGPVLSNFDNYEAIFTHIIDLRPIKDKWRPRDELYYIEGKTSFLHGWGIGKLTEFDSTSEQISLQIRPASSWIINQYRRKNYGKIRYYIKHVHLDGVLIPLSETECRIGIRGITSTNKPMPSWILTLMMRIIFPNLIKDIEKAVAQQSS